MDEMKPCPDPLELAYWLDGCLAPDRQEAVSRHLRICAACRFDTGKAQGESRGRATILQGPPSWQPRRQRILPPSGFTAVPGEALAAATESSPVPELPSVVIDTQRNVLRFRTDRTTGEVTAYLVYQRPEDQAFRVLLVADREFVTDARGAVSLAPLRAADLFGAFVEVPELLAEWVLETAAALPGPDQAMAPLPAPSFAGPEGPQGTFAVMSTGGERRIILEFSRPGWVVLLAEAEVVTQARATAGEPIQAALPATAPAALRLRFFA